MDPNNSVIKRLWCSSYICYNNSLITSEPELQKKYLQTWAQQRFRSACTFMQSDQTQSSLGALWIAKDAKFLYADKNLTRLCRLHRLIWVFFRLKVRFLMLQLKCCVRSYLHVRYMDNLPREITQIWSYFFFHSQKQKYYRMCVFWEQILSFRSVIFEKEFIN